jgi:hypothetical protein
MVDVSWSTLCRLNCNWLSLIHPSQFGRVVISLTLSELATESILRVSSRFSPEPLYGAALPTTIRQKAVRNVKQT